MRGSPPVQLALLLAGFILVAVPLMQLTSARDLPAQVAPAVVGAHEAKVPTTVRVRFAHKPVKLSLKLGAQELLAAPDLSASPVETSTDLLLPKEGIELQVSATWPDGTPDTALSIDLEPDALDAQSQTRWSTASVLQETLVYQWKP